MKKSFILLVLLLLVATFSFAADNKLPLIKPGTLVVAVAQTFPPFGYIDDKGNLVGLEIDIDKEICKRLGLQYEPIRIEWAGLIPSLNAGKIDMISNPMDITAERQKNVTFADAWLKSGGVLLVEKDSKIYKLSDIEGKKIGVLLASSWVPHAQRLKPSEIKYYESDVIALRDVGNKQVDASITDVLVASYAIKVNNFPIRIIDEYVTSLQKAHVFKKGNYELAKAVNKVLNEMYADGTYKQIASKYLVTDPFPPKEERIMTIFE
jgi:polar amino acid transport system substrate-binding protein